MIDIKYFEEDLEETEKERFVIDNDETADWALRKIAEAEKDAQKWTEFYKQQIQKTQKRAEDTINYMTALLKEYFALVPHRVTKSGQQKYTLPSGELVQLPEHIDYERDDAEILAWLHAENHTEYINTKESVMWSDLKKHIKETGELPDGVTIVQKPSEFKVR